MKRVPPMAFQLPAQQAQRPSFQPLSTHQQLPQQADHKGHEYHDREWVIFQPDSQTTSTDKTSESRGLSRLSEFGSSHTAGPVGDESDTREQDEGLEELDVDEDEERELDDHLHAFREHAVLTGSALDESGIIAPAHDGLGTFRTFPASRDVQEQISQHEKLAKHGKRRSEERAPTDRDDRDAERTRRIQEWRIEQSRVLLGEIEQETRRRRYSRTSDGIRTREGSIEEESASMGLRESYTREESSREMNSGQALAPEDLEDKLLEDATLWQRITQRIRQFLDIDSVALSALFGEKLNETTSVSIPSVKLGQERELLLEQFSGGWEERLLHRIAQELGDLLHRVAEPHPGAFSAYRSLTAPLEYAGLPSPNNREVSESFRSGTSEPMDDSKASSIQFKPTLPLVDESTPMQHQTPSLVEDELLEQERQYWEKELDVKMVWGFLQSRLLPNRRSSSLLDRRAVNPTPISSAARAAYIRSSHPLTRHNDSQRRREPRRPASIARSRSCRSGSGLRTVSGSSRNYWDLGHSVGGASSSVGVGAWGEI